MLDKEKKKSLTARKYLEQLQELDINISQDLEMLKEMKTDACSPGGLDYSKERVQTSHSGDSLGSTVSRYVFFEEEINTEIARFTNAKNQIISEIRGLHDKNYIRLLFKIYVQFKTLSQTSKEMNISYAYTLELHKKALSAFAQTYQNLDYLI